MKKIIAKTGLRKLAALALVFALIMGIVPFNLLADDSANYNDSFYNEEAPPHTYPEYENPGQYPESDEIQQEDEIKNEYEKITQPENENNDSSDIVAVLPGIVAGANLTIENGTVIVSTLEELEMALASNQNGIITNIIIDQPIETNRRLNVWHPVSIRGAHEGISITTTVGAFWVLGNAELTLSNITVQRNVATTPHTDNNGIQVEPGGVLRLNQGTVITGFTFLNGGTISAAVRLTIPTAWGPQDRARLYIDGAEITGNTRGISAGRADIVMTSGRIHNNRNEGNTTFNSGNGDGGGMSIAESTFIMYGGSIDNNFAQGSNGGGGILVNDSVVTLRGNASISNNHAVNGGGLLLDAHSDIFTNRNSVLNLYDNASISGNIANNDGGGVILRNATINMHGSSSISNNEAGRSGGGVMAATNWPLDNNSIIMNGSSSINNNTASVNGGGIAAINSTSGTSNTIIMNDTSVIRNNTATSNGGGVFISIANPWLFVGTSEIILNGNATISENTASLGGGIFTSSSSVILNSGLINENTAAGIGGGIFMNIAFGVHYDRMATLYASENVHFTGNQAQSGGAIGVHPNGQDALRGFIDLPIVANVTISGSHFSDNIATQGLRNDVLLNQYHGERIHGSNSSAPAWVGHIANNYDFHGVLHTPAPVFVVIFDGNGDDDITLTEHEITFGYEMPDAPQVVRDGYEFLGWYTTYEISLESVEFVYDDFTFYALWEAIPLPTFIVTFDGNDDDDVTLVYYEVTYGYELPNAPEVVREGHILLGWFTSDEISLESVEYVTDDLTFYANWEVIYIPAPETTPTAPPTTNPPIITPDEENDEDEYTPETPVITTPPVVPPTTTAPEIDVEVEIEVEQEQAPEQEVQTPETTTPFVPPTTLAPGNEQVVSDESDDIFVELDDEGVPLGTWIWDEDEEIWIFDPYVPLGFFTPPSNVYESYVAQGVMPQTGVANNRLVIAFAGISSLAIAISAAFVIRKQLSTK